MRLSLHRLGSEVHVARRQVRLFREIERAEDVENLDEGDARDRRRRRIRGRLSGTAARPRLAIHRNLLQIYAQVIDDASGTTLAAASTVELETLRFW